MMLAYEIVKHAPYNKMENCTHEVRLIAKTESDVHLLLGILSAHYQGKLDQVLTAGILAGSAPAKQGAE